tara:strand:- start:2367 stop:4076 length:1710 start_codon:yes stop_codon:yes gene_type:complete
MMNKNNDYFSLIEKKNNFLKKKIKHNLNNTINVKILGGYTNNEIEDWLGYFLLTKGVHAKIDTSLWGPAYSDLNYVKKNKEDFLVIINSWRDLLSDKSWFDLKIKPSEINKIFETFFGKIKSNVIITLFDKPNININTKYGNLEEVVDQINFFIKKLKENNKKNMIEIIDFDRRNEDEYEVTNFRDWYSFGKLFGLQQNVNFTNIIANKISNNYIPPKKLVIIDLDNTIWGGVIGDQVPSSIKIGDESPEGRIFRDIQSYLKMLKLNGCLLAIVSKNEEKIALNFLKDKRNTLKISDFVTYRINWEKKYKNILSIKKDLNIGLDSIVFLDDNPSERSEVMNFIPEVNVPDLGSSPEEYLNIINLHNYFNFKNISSEDKNRSSFYIVEKKREKLKAKASNYSQFLKSLNTSINFIKLNSENIDRVHQLTNKTNQFNFTSKRMQISEINKFKLKDKKILIISAKDKFGDYGIISVVYINIKKELEIENWLMSCRVFNKTIEHGIMKELTKIAKKNKKTFIKLTYLKNDKNKILENVIKTLGFAKTKKKNKYIFNLKKKFDMNKIYCRILHG